MGLKEVLENRDRRKRLFKGWKTKSPCLMKSFPTSRINYRHQRLRYLLANSKLVPNFNFSNERVVKTRAL